MNGRTDERTNRRTEEQTNGRTNLVTMSLLELLIVAKNNNDRASCPIWALLKFWKFMGRPAAGPIFRANNEKADLESTHKAVQKMAAQCKAQKLPGKHSGRVSCVNSLVALGASPDDIKRHLNWSPNSDMISHYVNSHLVTLPTAPAYLLQNSQNLHELQSLFI